MKQEITFLLNTTENIIGIFEIALTQDLISIFIPKMYALENICKNLVLLILIPKLS